MRAVDLIRAKRDGRPLEEAEIAWLVEGLGRGDVPDYQWSALLMAIYCRGMNDAETAALTAAMMRSGTIVDLSELPGPKIDKHSTGGVGDKTSLILAPIAAACGVLVPMVSGRGLGHTGGTLDKLEAIPGFRVDLDLRRYVDVLRTCGLVLIGQTPEIAPADKRLYALRDVTATVESIPLIAASIMSKKAAEGIDGLVLDVKTGDGAFMTTLEGSRKLAETMCRIGRNLGKRVTALITRMDQPLGMAVGHAVEVFESIACLKGVGPADLMGLSLELAAEMVVMGGLAPTLAEARTRCQRAVEDGSALERFRRVIEAQGGDPRVIDRPARLPHGRQQRVFRASRSGTISRLSARAVGQALSGIGAARARVDSTIDHAVGLLLHKKVGDPVQRGEPLCTLSMNEVGPATERACAMIEQAYSIDDGPIATPDLIVERH